MNANDSVPVVISVVGGLLAIGLLGIPDICSWRALSRTYPNQAFNAAYSFTSVSGQVGAVLGGYRNLLRVALGEQGLRISMPRLLQPLFPVLAIPWAAISDCRRENFYFASDALRLDIAHFTQPIHLYGFLWRYGDAASTIQTYWREHQSNDASSETD